MAGSLMEAGSCGLLSPAATSRLPLLQFCLGAGADGRLALTGPADRRIFLFGFAHRMPILFAAADLGWNSVLFFRGGFNTALLLPGGLWSEWFLR